MVDISQLVARMQIRIAYPHDKRAGAQGARDRDDIIDADWRKIDYNCGIYGAGNFPVGSTHNCTPIRCEKTIERGESCDFLVIDWEAMYYLTTNE